MILQEVARQTYWYILNTEAVLFVEFKINSIEIFDNLAMIDLYSYVGRFEHLIEKKNKQYSNTKQLATQLHALKVVLNSMDV